MKSNTSNRLVLASFLITLGILAFALCLTRFRQRAEAWEQFNYGPDRKGDAKAINLRILKQGKGVDGQPVSQWTDEERTQWLVDAVIYNDPATVQAIINKGILVNGTLEEGVTALHIAVVFRRADMVNILLKNGADASAEVAGMTPLDYMKWPPKTQFARIGTDEQLIQMLQQAKKSGK